MPGLEWKGVPLEHWSAWRELFNLRHQGNAMHLACACPICDAETLFRYYALGRVQPGEIDGNKYRGPGSYWEWCSSCRSFEHMSAFVPEWWKVEPLNIDHSKLTALPDLLDEAIAK
jgi:hypothetical protein